MYSDAGRDAVELCDQVGLILDDWQAFTVEEMLGEREDGTWASMQIGLEVARQNGKGGVYEAREIAGVVLFGERLLIHSAHEYKTAEQALNRMEAIIEGCADLSRRVKTVKRSHGQEGVYFKSGQVIRYFTRTSSAGRGFSCDFLGMDEAMHIKESMHAAMFPTMAARPNPQILYAGSAVDQATMPDGIVFASLRKRALDGGDDRMSYFGWSAPFDHPDDVTVADALDADNWAAANPAMGIRVTADYISAELRALSARGFAVERLGVGDWPDPDERTTSIISCEQWADVLDHGSQQVGVACFSVDVTPDRSKSAIGSSALRADGRYDIRVVKSDDGTDWVAGHLVKLAKNERQIMLIVDERSPAGALIDDIRKAFRAARKRIRIETIKSNDHAQACGVFFDAVTDSRSVRHIGQIELDEAIAGAVTRPLSESWAWSRRSSEVNIAPLVSVTLALWGARTLKPHRSRVVNLADALAAAENTQNH